MGISENLCRLRRSGDQIVALVMNRFGKNQTTFPLERLEFVSIFHRQFEFILKITDDVNRTS